MVVSMSIFNAVILVVVVFFGTAHCFGNGPSWEKQGENYATLTVPNEGLTMLLDTLHKYLTVKEAVNNTCYLVALETAPRKALRLIVHIYRQGLTVLLSEFPEQQAVSHGWVSSLLGSEQARFCQHSPRRLLLSPASATEAPGNGEEQGEKVDPLVG